MLSKSLIQFSLDGQGCVSSLLFDLSPNYGRGNEDNANSFKRSQACISGLSAPDPEAGHHQPTPLPETPWTLTGKSGSVSYGSLLLSPGSWCTQVLCVCVCVPSKSLFPQSCVKSVIKSHWPPKSNSLGVLSPFARSPGWEI